PEALLDACLRLPDPEVPGAGQGRDPYLGKRVGFVWSNQRLILTEHDTGGFPIHLQRSRPQVKDAVVRLAQPVKEIHIHDAMNLPAAERFRAAKFQANRGLAQRGAASEPTRVE